MNLPVLFAQECVRLGLRKGEPLGLAVSGGPDSLALLVLAQQVMPTTIRVATVDHGLRPEAADEAAFVAQTCADLGVPHETLAVSLGKGGNVQARARAERYGALGSWAARQGLRFVATAHHADDLAETLLMRLNRASGLRGLGAMRDRATLPGRTDVMVIRPLLATPRSELATVVERAGLDPVDDPSNSDPAYDRARIRKGLAEADWLDPMRLAASAMHLRDAADVLEFGARHEFAAQVSMSDDGRQLAYNPAGPLAVRFRVLEELIARLATEGTPRGEEVARLLESLEAGEKATLAGVMCTPRAGVWHFAAAPPRNEG
ncbi:tRNA lysidine(34) synthetase TilS [Croceicoccus ponticola]|uniref:tRNA(Ile)-lysidine synthase n=1 Tax=Croceicoccus ponticola TaxID=2217664 RepID=A0A437GY16_9SPHN|nr:tRNA lysidine(34) synthetase TilS [Croceicoccus ponticola]RVQ67549.1 tRNA lysidine(34) synthetase TilS [Croceicoccus ponticola]